MSAEERTHREGIGQAERAAESCMTLRYVPATNLLQWFLKHV